MWEVYSKDWRARYGQHSIRVKNSWVGGIHLIVNGELRDSHLWPFVVRKDKPRLRCYLDSDTEEPALLEVFVRAMLDVQVKIVVNGRCIASDSF